MMWYPASRKDYNVWMSQLVWSKGIDQCLRKDFICEFGYSIQVFMASFGYKMEERFIKELSLWLYRIHIQEVARKNHGGSVYLPDILHRNTEDDYDQYIMIVSEQDVDDFIDRWCDTEDLLENTHVGNRVRYGLHEFLFHVVNLDTSNQGLFIANLWNASDSNSDSENNETSLKSNGVDHYIEDAKDGFHGGRGVKV